MSEKPNKRREETEEAGVEHQERGNYGGHRQRYELSKLESVIH